MAKPDRRGRGKSGAPVRRAPPPPVMQLEGEADEEEEDEGDKVLLGQACGLSLHRLLNRPVYCPL